MSSVAELWKQSDSVVAEFRAAADRGGFRAQLEGELQQLCKASPAHDTPSHARDWLRLLHALRPVFPPTAFIATWWDLVLRPALRQPNLDPAAAALAVDLVVDVLAVPDADADDTLKVADFRRRLLDLYLLDAYNETDASEWADRDPDSRARRTLWKASLTRILVHYGIAQPEALMTQLFHCFAAPSHRVQLLTLLDAWSAHPAFPHAAARPLARHPLLSDVLLSLQLDSSATLCAVALAVLVKLLPIFAVEACEELRDKLPDLLAILARILCWKTRAAAASPSSLLLPEDLDDGEEEEPPLQLRPDLEWERLDLTFNASTPSAPPPRLLFTYLYYLFPCNTLGFLRQPASYLKGKQRQSPYTVDWDEALDEPQIRSKCEPILRTHVTHPSIIWRDASTEMAQPDRWATYDVSRIVGECTMLDMQNASHAAFPELHAGPTYNGPHLTKLLSPPMSREDSTPRMVVQALPAPSTTPPSTGEMHRISLQDMISTSIALRSNHPVEVVDFGDFGATWPSVLSTRAAGSPAKASTPLPLIDSESEAESSEGGSERGIVVEPPSPVVVQAGMDEEASAHARDAISSLQREVLLLRNELNFELWLKRENVKHVGRLYQDRILEKNAEVERQGLHNRLREYKRQVASLQEELKGYKAETRIAKNKTIDWNNSLTSKVKDLRDKRRELVDEAAALRAADKKVKTHFAAQKKLLAEAAQRIVELETTIKETHHKVERLRDYEVRIEQHTTMQRLWDDDVQRLKDQKEEMKIVMSKFKKQELRLESYEKTQQAMEATAAGNRERFRSLEAALKLKQLRPSYENPLTASIEAVSQRASASRAANERLRVANTALRDEVEMLRVKLEAQEKPSTLGVGPQGRTGSGAASIMVGAEESTSDAETAEADDNTS